MKEASLVCREMCRPKTGEQLNGVQVATHVLAFVDNTANMKLATAIKHLHGPLNRSRLRNGILQEH